MGVARENGVSMSRPALTPSAHRVAAVAQPRERGPWNRRALVFFAAGAVLGLLAGGLAARQRYKAAAIVAAVNGEPITQQEFYGRLEEAYGPAMLRQIVQENLQLQFAKNAGAAPSDAQIDARIASLRAAPGVAERLGNVSPDALRRAVRLQLSEAATIDKGVQVTDDDIKRFYRANIDPSNPKARYRTPEAAQVAVIVTDSEARCDEALHALQKGTPFGAAAKTYSLDPSRDADGVAPQVTRGIGWPSRIRGMESTIFAMRIGQQIGPRQYANAWWIIRCLDRRPAAVRPLKDVMDDCRAGTLIAKGLPANGKRAEQQFASFKKGATVQAFWKRYEMALASR